MPSSHCPLSTSGQNKQKEVEGPSHMPGMPGPSKFRYRWGGKCPSGPGGRLKPESFNPQESCPSKTPGRPVCVAGPERMGHLAEPECKQVVFLEGHLATLRWEGAGERAAWSRRPYTVGRPQRSRGQSTMIQTGGARRRAWRPQER